MQVDEEIKESKRICRNKALDVDSRGASEVFFTLLNKFEVSMIYNMNTQH